MPAKLRWQRPSMIACLCRNLALRAIIVPMDTVDRKILAELQADGRLTVTELAQRVALSVAPCHRRLRELERSGAIRGYHAIIDPAAVGLDFEVLVHVTMDQEDTSTIADFEEGL